MQTRPRAYIVTAIACDQLTTNKRTLENETYRQAGEARQTRTKLTTLVALLARSSQEEANPSACSFPPACRVNT
jgi:hypothetical protein